MSSENLQYIKIKTRPSITLFHNISSSASNQHFRYSVSFQIYGLYFEIYNISRMGATDKFVKILLFQSYGIFGIYGKN